MKAILLYLMLASPLWAMSVPEEENPSDGKVQRIYNRIISGAHIKHAPIISVEFGDVNAYYDGKRIVIYTGLLKFVRNEEELALVIAHELAHVKWHTETRADEYGALYLIAAGYNYCKAAQLFKRFGDGDPPIHPSGADRYKAMRCSK